MPVSPILAPHLTLIAWRVVNGEERKLAFLSHSLLALLASSGPTKAEGAKLTATIMGCILGGHSKTESQPSNGGSRKKPPKEAGFRFLVNFENQTLGEGNELERLLPEEDSIASTSSLAERPFSDSEDSDDFWKAFVTSSSPVDEVAKANNGFIPRSKYVSMVEKDSVESGKDESSKLPNSSKRIKQNKWKPEEVKKLIDLRRELHGKFQVVQGKMALWEKISGSLWSDGKNRSPGQCKSQYGHL